MRKRGGGFASAFRSLFGLRETLKQTPKSQEYRETLEKKNVEAEKKILAKLEADPEKSAAEYRKELNAYYDKQQQKKSDSKENLYRGRAPVGEGDAIARKSGKTPLQKYLEARAKLPPAPPPRQTTLSKLRNTTGRRTVVAGSKRRSRRRKLH